MLKIVGNACRSQAYPNLFVRFTKKEKCLDRVKICERNFFLLSHNCLYNYNVRHFVDKTSKIEKQERFIRFWEECRLRLIREKESANKLTTLLQLQKDEAEKLVEEEPQLFLDNIKTTSQKIEALMAVGVPPNVIINNKWVLHIALARLQLYLKTMKQWNVNKCYIQEFLPLLNESPVEFFRISEILITEKEYFPCRNRVLYLANKLDCSVSEVLPKMLKGRFLWTRTFNYFEEVLNMFREFGIKNEDILADLNCLSGSPSVMRERLIKLKEIGYHPIKPWLARYGNKSYEKAVEHFLAVKEASRYKSHEGYLAASFNMDINLMMKFKEQVEHKYPYFFRIRVLTFNKKLEFLRDAGYLPTELIGCPGVFYFKISTIKERIVALRKLGIEKPHLSQLCKSTSSFNRLIDNLLADRGIKSSDFISMFEDNDILTTSNGELES